jgi:hypothetical protein
MRAQSQNCGTSRDGVARERLCKHIVPTTMKEHATREELLEAVLCAVSAETL